MFNETKRCIAFCLALGLGWLNFASGLPDNFFDSEPTPTPISSLTIQELAVASTTWACLSCNHENPATASYCSRCGKAIGATRDEPITCLECDFVNDAKARYCGGCGHVFVVEESPSTPEMVYVPDRGYLPKGTLIEPSHSYVGLWVTGLISWVVVGPLVMLAGSAGDSIAVWVIGGGVSLSGLIMFIVGLASRTDPVYASLINGDTPRLTRRGSEFLEIPIF